MAISSTGSFPQKPKAWNVQILPADTTALKTLVTGSADGTKVSALIASSNDTAARDVQWGITTGGIFYPLGVLSLPITAGFIAATPPVNLFDSVRVPGLPLDSDGNPFVFLSSASWTLQVKALVTITAAKEIDFSAFGGDWS